jgi:hypothetical protein
LFGKIFAPDGEVLCLSQAGGAQRRQEEAKTKKGFHKHLHTMSGQESQDPTPSSFVPAAGRILKKTWSDIPYPGVTSGLLPNNTYLKNIA